MERLGDPGLPRAEYGALRAPRAGRIWQGNNRLRTRVHIHPCPDGVQAHFSLSARPAGERVGRGGHLIP